MEMFLPKRSTQVIHKVPNVFIIAMMRAVEAAFSMVDSSLTSGVIVNLVLAVVIRTPMKLMWNMLNTL